MGGPLLLLAVQGGYIPVQEGYIPVQGGYITVQGGYIPVQGGYIPVQALSIGLREVHALSLEVHISWFFLVFFENRTRDLARRLKLYKKVILTEKGDNPPPM